MPFVADKRLPEDTLFWIIEEDFRFWPPGRDPDEADDYEFEYMNLLLDRSADDDTPEKSLPPSKEAATGEGGSSLPPSRSRRKHRGQQRLETYYHTALPRGQTDEDAAKNYGFSRDVCDMMRIATMCHRSDMGDLIWVTYCPNKQHTSRIGHGSACILVTKSGMEAVRQAAKGSNLLQRGHIDLVLQAWLRCPGEAAKARACYLYPPIGSYTEHASGCDPKNFGGDKTRPSGFDSGENPCHGTREEGDPKHRTKYMLQWHAVWARRVWKQFAQEHMLHSEQFEWKSFKEPTAFGDQTWADWSWDSSGSSGQWRSNPGWTQRQKRAYRTFQMRMGKRTWVEHAEEAMCVSVVASDSKSNCSCITWCCRRSSACVELDETQCAVSYMHCPIQNQSLRFPFCSEPTA